MSYTPTEWKAGDTVTSAKLNKIEQGIVSSSESFIEECEFISDNTGDYFQSVHTLNELVAMCAAGKRVIFCLPQQQSTWIWPFTAYYSIVSYRYNVYNNDEIEAGFAIISNYGSHSQSFGMPTYSYINEINMDENTEKIKFYVVSDD